MSWRIIILRLIVVVVNIRRNKISGGDMRLQSSEWRDAFGILIRCALACSRAGLGTNVIFKDAMAHYTRTRHTKWAYEERYGKKHGIYPAPSGCLF